MGTFIDPYPGNGFWKSFTKTWHSKSYPQISPHRPELNANDKTIFITGGGTGIGRATAIAFAQAGAKAIAIFGRREDKLQIAADEIREIGKSTVVYVPVDLSQSVHVKKAFQNAIEKVGGGKIDVFISNAAIAPHLAPVAGYREEHLNEALRLNVNGPFNAIQAVLPMLAEKATVLNVTSGVAHIQALPTAWAYATTKAAVVKMFDYLQAENQNLRVINVQPGIVETEMSIKSGFEAQDESELCMYSWLSLT